jgi:hypothetical protein
VVVTLLLLASVRVHAEEDLALRVAQQEARLARSRLKAATGRYEGHRKQALDHVNRALREIRLGLLDAAVEREHGAARHDGAVHPAGPGERE